MVHRRGEEGAEDLDRLTSRVIGGAITVHRELGPGLLESAYESCLTRELRLCGLFVEREVSLPVRYRGKVLDCGYRLDLLVDRVLIVEVKCVDRIHPIHTAQILTYLRLSKLTVGLLLNFNVPVLRTGIHRVVNGFGTSAPSLPPR